MDEEDTAFSELQEKSGSTQVPYLVDSEKNISMSESNDIIEYLREHYAGTGIVEVKGKSRVHVGGSVCQSCEG